jgi:hypothetical protein
MDRPKKCPWPQTCVCIWHTYDADQRLCWGYMGKNILDQDLYNNFRSCEDGQETDQRNTADAFYTAFGNIAIILYALKNHLYNPCPDLAIADPVRELSELLEGKRLDNSS